MIGRYYQSSPADRLSYGDLNLSKVRQAAKHLRELNPNVTLVEVEQKVSFSELESLIQDADVALDCSDNFALRKDLNRACFLNRVPLVSGSAVRYEGQLTVFDFRDENSACYECLFGESMQMMVIVRSLVSSLR
ncbi:HesA/MoeB/ThiF family protein [Ignatzschineria indica]|uniref:HesA/MoeB/ThiF family protein n=1 Tax=Ignatzschineria indica TaxID=472583 RepID=UPI003628041A